MLRRPLARRRPAPQSVAMTARLRPPPVRLAVRAVILRAGRLLIVNAHAGSDRLWCAPGGGVEPHRSLHENLLREVFEETGLAVVIGPPCLINEFHDPDGDFHQVDVYFRCRILSGDPEGDWTDPEGIVTHRRWVTRAELGTLGHKPDSLAEIAWGDGIGYDALEPILR